MITLTHSSAPYSGYLWRVCVNAYVAVEKNGKTTKGKRHQKSTLVDPSAICSDPVGLGEGWGLSFHRRLRTNNSRREVAQSVSQKNIVFLSLYSTQLMWNSRGNRSSQNLSQRLKKHNTFLPPKKYIRKYKIFFFNLLHSESRKQQLEKYQQPLQRKFVWTRTNIQD